MKDQEDDPEMEEGADTEITLDIGTFPDDLPQLLDYVTITDNFEHSPD